MLVFEEDFEKEADALAALYFDLNKKVQLRKQHFTRWLYLFHQTIDELYSGTKATLAKERSVSIANLMQNRIGKLGDCTEL